MIDASLITPEGLKKPVQSPGDEIVIDGEHMRISPTEVATHLRRVWMLGEQRFAVFHIESPVTLHVEHDERPPRSLGRFEKISLVDGMVLFDLEAAEPLLHFEYPLKTWYLPADDSYWQRVIFKAAT